MAYFRLAGLVSVFPCIKAIKLYMGLFRALQAIYGNLACIWPVYGLYMVAGRETGRASWPGLHRLGNGAIRC